MPAFGETSTTDDVLEGVDLRGKTALVTGASAGIGVETTRALAAHGASVIMAVRDVAKGQAAAGPIREAGGEVELREVDLADLTSIRRFTDAVSADHEAIHLLVANAGVMATPFWHTKDGFEMQIGTNHIGHFLLVNRLLPLVLAAAPSRIVVLTSSGHRFSDVNLDDPNFETTAYDPWQSYGRAKTANALFALELDRRYASKGVRAASVHPGAVPTELGRDLTEEAMTALIDANTSGQETFWKSIPQGAATSVWAAVTADGDEIGGRFLEDCHVAEPSNELGRRGGVHPWAQDPESAKALWAATEGWVGETFPRMTRFADVAAASVAATATRSRLAKVAAFVELFGRLDPEEVVPVVAWLSGDIRQGRIGVGWATVAGLDVDAGVEPVLEIGEVDATFAELAVTTGPGSVGARNQLLRSLFSRATPTEIGLLRGLIQGGIRQGALESLVGDAVAKATGIPVATVRRAAMLAGDLPSVARLAVTEGEAAVAAVGLSVGRAVQPMLAASAATVAEALELTGEASVEWKLDGARIQVHRDGDEVHLYTRNLNEITDRLPTIVDVVRSFPAQQLVLDGEAIGIDAESERPDRFQETMSRFGSHAAGGGSMLVGRFFDVLHRDGEDLMDRPLAERLAILDEVCGVTAMPRLVTSDPEAAAAFADEAIALGHEGVMVKAIDSTYDAGRRGGSWRKVKPVRTFDLVVLAVEWGSGRRRGWLSNLHLGARAVDPDDGFVMVGKTFKGMTDDLLTWQTEQLLAREVSRDGHVVHVRPELVVEIALDGVQRSTRYPGGLALRFARVRGYRDDKDPSEADLITSLQALL